MEWIATKDRLPNSSEEIVLVYIDNLIYLGRFSACEIYNINTDGSKKSYRKIITFSPLIWLDNNHCQECEIPSNQCGVRKDKCADCCDKDYRITLLNPEFDLTKITHWMPLPNQPERSKREDLGGYNNCKWNNELSYDPGCNSKHPLRMRCSEHCGNTVREAQ